MDASGHASENKDLEKKRLRNRLAQRAFRRRQANRLRELRDQVNLGDKPYDETIKNLQEENSCLRKNLIQVQSNLARLIATMQKMSRTISDALGESSQKESSERHTSYQVSAKPDTPSSSCEGFDLGLKDYELADIQDTSINEAQIMAIFDYTQTDDRTTGALLLPKKTAVNSNLAKDAVDFNSPARQIPSIWSFEYGMGIEPYADALARREDSGTMRGRSWIETNSPFSDHIQVLQSLLKSKITHRMPPEGPTMNLFYKEVLVMLSLFNSMNRPDVMRWYAKTRFYHIVHLTAWQIYPCTRTFNAIHPQYRPTALQIQSDYPRTIDWIPFQSIRDRLIRLHAANPLIDQIICDAVSSYVVETCMADLIVGAPATKVYIRVTDLITNIDEGASPSGVGGNAASLPVPDVATLFSSPACSKAIFNLLNVDRGVSNYKVDPAFFYKFPELYDPRFDIVANGIPLRPDVQHRLSCPKPLTPQIFQTYRNFLDFSYDSSIGANLFSD
ncbi:hypothetical protein BGW36DRAFT_402300 [Talaromyces proteolyticus]|uniref:BZIP domain-containing protein n=1 Tax=Talaromyces proteolyticus TaxID=1131652 RepID=A0AAD4KE14_9EURO|nr:uncharacterized protein BGW36DRAFT_402300 [Talaromyces proteolyticus]KAH8688799.1 hypothetical protein BGW36DRAFT_402300 [Talaromyces proteolyticus]